MKRPALLLSLLALGALGLVACGGDDDDEETTASAGRVTVTTSDTAVETAKTFTVILSTPSGATLGATTTATVTLNDNDAFGRLQAQPL